MIIKPICRNFRCLYFKTDRKNLTDPNTTTLKKLSYGMYKKYLFENHKIKFLFKKKETKRHRYHSLKNENPIYIIMGAVKSL